MNRSMWLINIGTFRVLPHLLTNVAVNAGLRLSSAELTKANKLCGVDRYPQISPSKTKEPPAIDAGGPKVGCISYKNFIELIVARNRLIVIANYYCTLNNTFPSLHNSSRS